MNKIGFNVLAWSAVISDDLKPIVEVTLIKTPSAN